MPHEWSEQEIIDRRRVGGGNVAFVRKAEAEAAITALEAVIRGGVRVASTLICADVKCDFKHAGWDRCVMIRKWLELAEPALAGKLHAGTCIYIYPEGTMCGKFGADDIHGKQYFHTYQPAGGRP